MGGNGVSDICTRAGEGAGRRVNGAGLTLGSVAGSGAGGSGRIMDAEAGVHKKLAEVWGIVESDRGRFDEKVLGG